MNKRQRVVLAALVALVAAGWVLVNRSGRFGLSRFGLTTYSRVPVPIVDLQIRSDGSLRWVGKSHELTPENLAWLLEPRAPEVLVIALGWRSAAKVALESMPKASMRIVPLPTEEAFALYNSLKDRGVSVAIHVHSTC